jgi:hypothetical protein
MLRGFDEWFAKATNRDAEQRFTSAQDLASTLKDVVAAASGAHAFAAAPLPPTALMPAPPHADMASGAPFVPAATGGPAPAGAAPSVSSMNTSQALESARRGSSALPWILLVAVLLVCAVGATVLLLRPKSSDAAAEAAASAASAANAAPAVPSHELALAPAPDASVTNSAATMKPVGKARSTSPDARKEPGTTPPPATPETARPQAAGTVASPAAGATTCYVDPFSGQVRGNGPGHPRNALSFACKRDPFTGAYKRL